MRKKQSNAILHVIFKVVQILFKEKLGELSGNAQRSLFQVIGRMIDMGLLKKKTQRNEILD